MSTHGKGTMSTIEIINCNHGGYHTVIDRARADRMLGQIQRHSARRWEVRKHGEYRQAGQTFTTKRDAVASLV